MNLCFNIHIIFQNLEAYLEDYELVYEVEEYNNKQLCEVLCELCCDILHAIIDKIHQTRLGGILQRSRLYTHTSEAVIAFDTFCRYFFPATFSFINIVYWVLYTVIL